MSMINVHIDSTDFVPASAQIAGMNYGGDTLTSLATKTPAITCPICGLSVSALGGVKPLYAIVVVASNGKFKVDKFPACPLKDLVVSEFAYTVDPCGCKVSSDWAAAFTRELNRRGAGKTGKKIVALTEPQITLRLAKFEHALTSLYKMQTAEGVTEAQKRDIDFWIIVVIDQMQRIVPSPKIAPSPQPITPAVVNWADKNSFTVPIVKTSIGKALTEVLDDTVLATSLAAFGYGPSVKMPNGLGSALGLQTPKKMEQPGPVMAPEKQVPPPEPGPEVTARHIKRRRRIRNIALD